MNSSNSNIIENDLDDYNNIYIKYKVLKNKITKLELELSNKQILIDKLSQQHKNLIKDFNFIKSQMISKKIYSTKYNNPCATQLKHKIKISKNHKLVFDRFFDNQISQDYKSEDVSISEILTKLNTYTKPCRLTFNFATIRCLLYHKGIKTCYKQDGRQYCIGIRVMG